MQLETTCSIESKKETQNDQTFDSTRNIDSTIPPLFGIDHYQTIVIGMVISRHTIMSIILPLILMNKKGKVIFF
jgi:hypothetical protein